MDDIEKLFMGQKEFQRFVGFPIDSILEKDRNDMSEKYAFKMIEEIIELRKEFPSISNPWSRSQKPADIQRIKDEMADVLLFFINFANVWRIPPLELLDSVMKKQVANFDHIKTKKMEILDNEILRVPGYTSGVGSGNLTPKYVFIGQNPGKNIEHGYKFWSQQGDGASKILLPVLDRLGILEDSYLTNVVKCVTDDNGIPDGELTQFWLEFLYKELKILSYNNPEMKIVLMGGFVQEILKGLGNSVEIYHPAFVLRGGITENDYFLQVQKALAPNN